MYKKFLNAILFGALILGSAGTITSCKDYDDEIDEINQRISNIGGLSDQLATLTSQLSTAASEASAAKSSATSALEAASKAAEAAKSAGDAAAQATADAAVAKATADAAAADAKAEAIAAAKAEVEELAKKIDAAPKGLSDDDIAKLKAEVDKATAKVTAILGHRLQSLAVIPTTHINGIAAITLKSLTYVPQEWNDISKEHNKNNWGQKDEATNTFHSGVWGKNYVRDHSAKLDAKKKPLPAVYVSTEKNTAYYHVSPNDGVRTQDIEMPEFEAIMSENMTRAEEKPLVTSPIEATSYEINKNVLTVNFKKKSSFINTPITTKGKAHTEDTEDKVTGYNEKFYMVSLKAPISEENLQADEKEKGAFVNSEYVRLEEEFLVPYIANAKSSFDPTKIETNKFGDEVQKTSNAQIGNDGLFVHYHDSVAVYESEVNKYVDIKALYSEPLDLKKWVTVCVTDENSFATNHVNHENLTDYEDYGLGFRFYIAGWDEAKKTWKAPYKPIDSAQGTTQSNQTNQQEFASVTKDGIVTSKVYSINEANATAVGREPIIRVELWDEVNNNMIAVRYIKIKWVQSVAQPDPVSYEYPAELFTCADYLMKIGTKVMNEKFYAVAQEGGMTKAQFHKVYNDPEVSTNTELNRSGKFFTDAILSTVDPTSAGYAKAKKVKGIVELLVDPQDDVETYNILWTLTNAQIAALYPKWNEQDKLTFYVTYTWTSASASPLAITMKKVLYKPAFDLWGYDGRYWRNTSEKWTVFNVNPIVYNTVEANPAWNDKFANPTSNPDHPEVTGKTWNNLTSNIYTDLLNGFLDDQGKKPIIGAGGVIFFKDGEKTGKYYYQGNYGLKKYTWNNYGKAANNKTLNTLKSGVERTAEDATYAAYAANGVRFTFDEGKLKTGDAYVYNYYDATKGEYKKLRATVKDNNTQEPKLYINNELAATIVNNATNSIDDLEIVYNIKLEEKNPNHKPWSGDVPTEAAKAIVGELVPIKLVADICGGTYAEVLIKAYDAFIIEPLQAPDPDTSHFTDATIDGSTIFVANANIYRSWNADADGIFYPVISKDTDPDALKIIEETLFNPKSDKNEYPSDYFELAKKLGNFYEAIPGKWETDKIKTNLKLDADGNLIPTDGYKDGPVPSNTEVVYNEKAQTLTYHNYSGTPVNNNYKMYIPVTYGYKWKTYVDYLEVEVYANEGTPDKNK